MSRAVSAAAAGLSYSPMNNNDGVLITTAGAQQVARRLWWLTLLRGLLFLTLGLFAIFNPGLTTQAFFQVFGFFSILDGVVALITGLSARRTGWGWTTVQGVAGILIGLIAVFRPQAVAAVIVIFLAMWALVIGLFQVAMAFQLRGSGLRSWIWMLVSGAVTTLLGLYFLINPEVGAAFLSVTVGAFMLAVALVLILGAFQLRRSQKEFADTLR